MRADNQDVDRSISGTEVDRALSCLGNKATGIDGLDYATLKEKSYRIALVYKLTTVFNRWWNGQDLPAYLKVARIVSLSKDGTEAPPEGDIRTIAIIPQLTKVYETIIHSRLEEQIQAKRMIHET